MRKVKENRPIIDTVVDVPETTPVERFQNETIRPVVKMQHDLLITYFRHYLISRKIKLKECNEFERIKFIETAFQKDNRLRNEVRGLIVGQFTVDEFNFYARTSNEFGKRIIGIVKQRISTSLDQLIV